MGFIHNNLKVIMAERGLNIQDVKNKTNLSRTTISNLYNDYASGIQYDTLMKLCHAMKCQPGDIFTYIDIEINIKKDATNSDVHVSYNNGAINIKCDFIISCSIVYNEKEYKFVAPIYLDVQFLKGKKRCINYSNICKVKNELKQKSYPYHVENYIFDKINEFIENLATKYKLDADNKHI